MRLIEADSEDTWPVAMRDALERNADDIAAYHAERARIDRAAEQDVLLRIDRPVNRHRAAWDTVIEISDEAMAGHHLAGFHATRLTDAESEDILMNGLRVLTPELFERRLEGVSRVLSSDILTKLRTRNQVHESNRSGMTWFCFTQAMLCDEWGVERLFRSWGGEALYNSHENDDATGPVLASLGKPCVIVAGAPIAGIESFLSIGQRLVNAWCARRGIQTGDGYDFEGYVRADIPGSGIMRIVAFDDPEFAVMTKHDSWDTPLR